MVRSCHRPAPANGPFRRCRLAFLAVASRTQTEEDAMRDGNWWRRTAAATAAAAVLALVMPLGGAPATAEADRGGGSAEVVVAWNQKANEIAFAEDQFLTFKGARAYAMAHIAQHDALNAVIPVYRQFAYRARARRAHPVVAAAQAAHDVLLEEYPGQRATLDALLAEHLAGVPDGSSKTAGVALGRRSAEAILAARVADGYDVEGTYSFGDDPGDYQTTPPWDGFVFRPGFRFARPFAMAAPGQFRPRPPPALSSAAYAEAFNEVKDVGRVDSQHRTAEQTGYAVWWMEFAEGSMNRLARNLATRTSLDPWRAARLFAQLNVGLFDSYLAVWDAKFHYDHWRPYTAIREAASDGNPRTAPDPTWEPLRTTPPFPDYVSAHSAVCGSSMEILRRTFRDGTRFTMDSATAPPDMPTRSFDSFSAAADECADSRVRLGFHFRYATDQGKRLGRKVALRIHQHWFQPTPNSVIRRGTA
jgi:hypothetical protein